ncbi:transcriptional regulator [Haloferax sp. Atlit-10N]|uniref:ArsR family transcriptional regulator n=1 Tax=Haloferax prahovense (strain DSM 18310 / JCM 13924 / TL6) TaxID=1227461 RepID=M0G018_HALPT|nr:MULTISPECIES: transcriptional regulator [Haloferax]ELZ65641.1 ArsR family transcriptional regulator [Haloferax prahovense DSM 18310]RDZ44905.1 transcriptional regulator [Haloferax sp. Atlit-16N]RDZ48256.1 transcriptional regulator [Haloferax sp. Atlit-19N]RDZ59317.1 transcriptional regulator [Haloferax sp. Atlit-10N]
MCEESASEEVYRLLDDEYARTILTSTDTTAKSAKELSEVCDASLPTIYRRTERLIDCGLLEEQTELEGDGHHYSVYKARLKRLTVELENNELKLTIEEREPETMADRFTRIWEEL